MSTVTTKAGGARTALYTVKHPDGTVRVKRLDAPTAAKLRAGGFTVAEGRPSEAPPEVAPPPPPKPKAKPKPKASTKQVKAPPNDKQSPPPDDKQRAADEDKTTSEATADGSDPVHPARPVHETREPTNG